MKLKIIITGVTGMVGEGVLHECLQHQDVEGYCKQVIEVRDIVALAKM